VASTKEFEWDAEKAATNRRKHGIDFDEAIRSSTARFFSTIESTIEKRRGAGWRSENRKAA
jgi:uncharacterized DUF497 family protein